MWPSSAQYVSLATILLSGATIAAPPSSGATNATAPLNDTVKSKDAQFLRGVNLGGWLVLEKWMNPNVFTGAFADGQIRDQFTFDAANGAAEALQKHWDTFFTEEDVKTISDTGINALRIPIGFWAYDNKGLPYQEGADAYLKKAIDWARKYNMKVWVDLHGLPGSQNSFDNSGQTGAHEWQHGNNLERSINVLKVMATEYGSDQYADVVVGLELVNEPKPD
jgi:glucan 1,3-beta-glucosidase